MFFTLTGTNLDAPDANALAGFYRRLLGWTVVVDDPGWVVLRPPGGGRTLNFQTESRYIRPVWPAGPGDPQMRAEQVLAGTKRGRAVRRPAADTRLCRPHAGDSSASR
jgi:hypothetical protein